MYVEVSSVDDQHLEVTVRDQVLRIDRRAEPGAPSDGFRATELLLAALGACMVGTALEFTRRLELPVSAITMHLEDETAKHPTRVTAITATLSVDGAISDKDLERIGRVAARCKVHNTLTAEGAPVVMVKTRRAD